MKRNYKSDFAATIYLRDGSRQRVPFPDCDWEAVFWGGSRACTYTISCRGGVYVNCRKADDGNGIVAIFKGHKLAPGPLHWEPHFFFPNDMFPYGIQDIYRPERLDITLVTGAGDDPTTAEVESILPYIKGKDFTYEDFTPEQIEQLQKPATDAAAKVNELEQQTGELAEKVDEQTQQMADATAKVAELSQKSADLATKVDELSQQTGGGPNTWEIHIDSAMNYDGLHEVAIVSGSLVDAIKRCNSGSCAIRPNDMVHVDGTFSWFSFEGAYISVRMIAPEENAVLLEGRNVSVEHGYHNESYDLTIYVIPIDEEHYGMGCGPGENAKIPDLEMALKFQSLPQIGSEFRADADGPFFKNAVGDINREATFIVTKTFSDDTHWSYTSNGQEYRTQYWHSVQGINYDRSNGELNGYGITYSDRAYRVSENGSLDEKPLLLIAHRGVELLAKAKNNT